jgi:hypothetical protein
MKRIQKKSILLYCSLNILNSKIHLVCASTGSHDNKAAADWEKYNYLKIKPELRRLERRE